MQDFHFERARALLGNAEEIFDEHAVQAAVRHVAETLNARFGDLQEKAFPLVLGVMGGAVVFTGHLLPQLKFPLEFADKTIKRSKPIKADIVGLTIPDKFVVGFGMDVYGYWRNLPGLWAIRQEDLKAK